MSLQLAPSSEAHVRLVRTGKALTPPQSAPKPVHITNPSGLWVREGPASYEDIVNEVSDDQEFVAFETSTDGDDTWYRIHLPCGNTGVCDGWIAGRVDGKTYSRSAADAPQVEVTGTGSLGLKIRAAPNGSKIDAAYDGQRFVPFASKTVAGSGCSGPWYRIHLPTSSNADAGWICGDYTRPTGDIAGPVLSISGKVTKQGAPFSGNELWLSRDDMGWATSDGDGDYRFDGLDSGSFTIEPISSVLVYDPSSVDIELDGASRSGVDFRACDPSAPLTGRVTDADASDRPLSGVMVYTDNGQDETNTNGEYLIAGIGCGKHRVFVQHGRYGVYNQPVDTFDTSVHDIALTKKSNVYGMQDNTGSFSDPVNTATGNYIYQRRDLELPGIGMPLRFDRAYNSREASSAGA
ncbi:MAG: DUF6531 domain-containing protein, partial [Thiohalocapsa sp.]